MFADALAGMIVMWGGTSSNLPHRWFICDGSELQTRDYPELFNAIGYNFGRYPAEGKFFLPDLRGRFIRGVDTAESNRDPNRSTREDMQDSQLTYTSVGSVQSFALQDHKHKYFKVASGDSIDNARSYGFEEAFTSGALEAQLSSETRPLNAYLYFIIKY